MLNLNLVNMNNSNEDEMFDDRQVTFVLIPQHERIEIWETSNIKEKLLYWKVWQHNYESIQQIQPYETKRDYSSSLDK